MIIDITKLKKYIFPAVMSVPGVAGFIDNHNTQPQTQDLAHTKLWWDVEVDENDENINININVVLIKDINVKEVCEEVQIRTRYEIDKNFNISKPYFVNIVVRDVLTKNKE